MLNVISRWSPTPPVRQERTKDLTSHATQFIMYRFTRHEPYQSETCFDTSVLHKRHVYKLVQIIDPLCAISALYSQRLNVSQHSQHPAFRYSLLKDDIIDFPYFFINNKFPGFVFFISFALARCSQLLSLKLIIIYFNATLFVYVEICI